jgi:hypothetical protein
MPSNFMAYCAKVAGRSKEVTRCTQTTRRVVKTHQYEHVSEPEVLGKFKKSLEAMCKHPKTK